MSSSYERNQSLEQITGKYVMGDYVCPVHYQSYKYRQRIHALLKEHLTKYGTKTYKDTLAACDAMCYLKAKRVCDCTKDQTRECLGVIEDNFHKITMSGEIYGPAYLEGVLKKTVLKDDEDHQVKERIGELSVAEIIERMGHK